MDDSISRFSSLDIESVSSFTGSTALSRLIHMCDQRFACTLPMSMPMSRFELVAKWSRILNGSVAQLTRSSHALTVASDKAYIFGGELKPR